MLTGLVAHLIATCHHPSCPWCFAVLGGALVVLWWLGCQSGLRERVSPPSFPQTAPRTSPESCSPAVASFSTISGMSPCHYGFLARFFLCGNRNCLMRTIKKISPCPQPPMGGRPRAQDDESSQSSPGRAWAVHRGVKRRAKRPGASP